MTKEEIALQLTLKAVERMSTPISLDSNGYNSTFSKQVFDFYNYLYNNLDNTITM